MLPYKMDELLARVVETGSSDLHVVVGSPPSIRLHGSLEPLVDGVVTPADAQLLVTSIMTKPDQDTLMEHREVDFAYSLPGVSRFRVNACFQRDSISAVLRAIPANPPMLESMGLPPAVTAMTTKPRGLVLVTGPTGSGKSTTLAAMVNFINRNRSVRIVTVEDPIEFLHSNVKSVITQREVGRDTHSFSNALRSALRQDPDVILVGEMRDLETISLALTAAETGHLVFATLHVTSAPESINRMVDVFAPQQQEQVRIQLASVLEAVFTQTLVPKKDGGGRVCAMEILLGSSAVRNLIRENKPSQMVNAMQTGSSIGMQTLEKHLAGFVHNEFITLEAALEKSSHPDELKRFCEQAPAKPRFASAF
ncbi:MAG: type IV pilus twitching motility protein PilT [Candidatus Eremiobacteraeota bacterium]|nr:type IV pilus twitching motility protein PilT [Candidatus Eremiobacteraeota bacterium]MBC5828239.1 type IV pilus twitching motility protein PilT [Candidatus Eremiobacteraeota bacterium]